MYDILMIEAVCGFILPSISSCRDKFYILYHIYHQTKLNSLFTMFFHNTPYQKYHTNTVSYLEVSSISLTSKTVLIIYTTLIISLFEMVSYIKVSNILTKI
jgi:hypothetical protein